VLADDTGGWGSTALQLVQELRDDFPLQPLWYYSLQEEQEPPGVQQQQQQSAAATSTTRQSLARTLSVAELTQLVTLYVPLAPPPLPIPRVQSMAAHRYHSSAVLAAALDTITLPMRSTGVCVCYSSPHCPPAPCSP
jgi:Tubulin domain